MIGVSLVADWSAVMSWLGGWLICGFRAGRMKQYNLGCGWRISCGWG